MIYLERIPSNDLLHRWSTIGAGSPLLMLSRSHAVSATCRRSCDFRMRAAHFLIAIEPIVAWKLTTSMGYAEPQSP